MRIGIDLGGTKIEAILLDDSGRESFRKRIPTTRFDYEKTIHAIVDLVGSLESRADFKPIPVGIGTPGALSHGRLKNSNSTWLIGKPLQQDLEARLDRRVPLANDADCFALSEATDGAGAGAYSVFGAILGTGVGGGIVVDGKLVQGPNAIAGEWGHNSLPWITHEELPGATCYCGLNGCIETFLSGPGLSRDLEEVSGIRLDAQEIAQYYFTQPSDAILQAWDRYLSRLARALAHVINFIDPEVIVLGGGVSNFSPIYTQVPKIWDKWVFSDRVATRLLPAKYGDSSGVRGAAWLNPG